MDRADLSATGYRDGPIRIYWERGGYTVEEELAFYLPGNAPPVLYKLTPGPQEFPVHPLFFCQDMYLLEHVAFQ